jgi:nitroimidazol reductase NimA-like FMN-containing flavoprotein (pyridoxamine 5'-phosphate oxidase superfamily)
MILTLPQKSHTKKSSTIPDEALKILREGFFAYLGTAEPRCEPHVTAMFYIWDESINTIYLVTSKESKKVLNIRRNRNVSVTIDQRDPISPAGNSGVMIRGQAFLIEMELADYEIMLRYMEKYIDFLGTGYPLGSRIAIRVTPKSISYWKGIMFYKWTNPTK